MFFGEGIRTMLFDSKKHSEIISLMSNIRRDMELGKCLLGALHSKRVSMFDVLDNIHDAEFRVFSQWGDDGIIQYLVNRIPIHEKKFIEFGVANYEESNTKFLLMNNNWSGLIMDSSEININHIKGSDIYWRHDLVAEYAFVTAENVNEVISRVGYNGDVGLLHIDIDGNDYWVWKALTIVCPIIAIIEYNSLWGIERPITVPYDASFNRYQKHHSGLYAGASLLSLCDLADEKDYAFIGSNDAGNNAYFVKKEYARYVKIVSPQDGYVLSKFREHRDEKGMLTFMPGVRAIESLRGMRVWNTRNNQIEEF